MGDQEIDVLQKLHLSTACDHCHHHPAAACGHSTKRSRSPVSRFSTLRPPSSPSTAAANQDFRGFNKIPLPEYFTTASPPPLRRTLSEPIPVFDQQAAPATAGTPPRPPARRNSSRSPSYEENPSSKKLKRMKERMREMSQWWNEFSSEDDVADADADADADDDQNFDSRNINDTKEECDEHVENPSQEAVFVEKSGESLVLHFKCPCGDGYQILLSGNNCYYKLTNFRNC